MTKKHKRIKLTIPKPLLIQIIETTEDGELLDNRICELIKKGIETGQCEK